MWDFAVFRPFRYVWLAGWHRDGLLPMAGLLGAAVLAARHGYARGLRLTLILFLVPCFLMSALMPITAGRYSYHLIPFLILLNAAFVVAAGRALVRLARAGHAPTAWRWYARGVAAFAVVVFVAVNSGVVLYLSKVKGYAVATLPLGVFQYPNLAGPVDYMRQHYQEGDVVLAIHPDVVDHEARVNFTGSFPEGWATDYWLQTVLQLPAVMDDRRPLPLHRWCGTVTVTNLADLETVFARHRRVWYVTIPFFHDRLNETEVTAFLREHMDVVYEDFTAVLLFRGEHRSPALRREGERQLREANTNFLR
jgi:hypothetical protein